MRNLLCLKTFNNILVFTWNTNPGVLGESPVIFIHSTFSQRGLSPSLNYVPSPVHLVQPQTGLHWSQLKVWSNVLPAKTICSTSVWVAEGRWQNISEDLGMRTGWLLTCLSPVKHLALQKPEKCCTNKVWLIDELPAVPPNPIPLLNFSDDLI